MCFVLFRNVSKTRHFFLFSTDIVNCMCLYQIIIKTTSEEMCVNANRRCSTALLCFISTERIITQYQYSWGWRKESHKEQHTARPEDASYLFPSGWVSLCKSLDEEESMAVRTALSTGWSKSWPPSQTDVLVSEKGLANCTPTRNTVLISAQNYRENEEQQLHGTFLVPPRFPRDTRRREGIARQNIALQQNFFYCQTLY